jgi:hypothetical protein
MISLEPIGSLPGPLGLVEAVRAQGGYFNSTLELPLAKVTAPALPSESIEGR